MAVSAGTAGIPFDAEAAELGRLTNALHQSLVAAFGSDQVDDGLRMRVHGDYHLGQVARASGRWYVFDFEGEPARTIEERRALTSPAKDVAGMLRSFGYASAMAGAPAGWEAACRASFLEGYGAVPGGAEVLRAFELEKAEYELRYEEAYRPEWAWIPRAAVERLGNP